MSPAPRRTRRHRPALLVLSLVAAAVCLLLAWWQWNRFESTNGTGQNLGYALQWPAFAASCIWAYRRFVVLEDNPEEVEKLKPKGLTEIPDGILPERPTTPSASSFALSPSAPDDETLQEYNTYLATLDAAEGHAVGNTQHTEEHHT
ncbi:MAG: transcriptional regulator [Gordonia sp. (in: high G+C Gram-positive bacteria)]